MLELTDRSIHSEAALAFAALLGAQGQGADASKAQLAPAIEPMAQAARAALAGLFGGGDIDKAAMLAPTAAEMMVQRCKAGPVAVWGDGQGTCLLADDAALKAIALRTGVGRGEAAGQ
ncbi:MAG: hypothetical protein HC779_06865 [Phyllobacteriaceae bacterium]|nr:hypothetical protein [Phyllobacteriaceae bacterium]